MNRQQGRALLVPPTGTRHLLLLVFGAALLGRLLVFQSWWCLDDWGQLARAAGHLQGEPEWTARMLSQRWWWSMTWPLLGLNAPAHAFLRMLLHASAAVAVCRMAMRTGISREGSLLAGLFFAASPIAFTPLYWASGIQELLAGVLVLWAVERWFSGHRFGVIYTVLLGFLSMLAKEPGLLLPLFLLVVQLYRKDRNPWRWVAVGLLMAAAALAVLLVSQHFATGNGQAYSTGGMQTLLWNLGQYGVVLSLPTPIFFPRIPWPLAAWGLLPWILWSAFAFHQWRKGRALQSALVLGALLSLAPALPLLQQSRPYMAYTASAAVALLLGSLLKPRWDWVKSRPALWAVTLLAALFAFVSMHLRLDTSDSVIRATGHSSQINAMLQEGVARYPGAAAAKVIVFQQPLRPETVRQADLRGPQAVRSTPWYNSVSGTMGLNVLVPGESRGQWLNALAGVSGPALVLCETGRGLEIWGPMEDALLYAAVIDLAVGNYARAAAELQSAGERGAQVSLFPCDREILPLQKAEFLRAGRGFRQWFSQPWFWEHC